MTNAVYAGYVTYAGSDEHGNRTQIPVQGRRKLVKWFDGKHKALVSLELFRKVVCSLLLDRPSARTATTAARPWKRRGDRPLQILYRLR